MTCVSVDDPLHPLQAGSFGHATLGVSSETESLAACNERVWVRQLFAAALCGDLDTTREMVQYLSLCLSVSLSPSLYIHVCMRTYIHVCVHT